MKLYKKLWGGWIVDAVWARGEDGEPSEDTVTLQLIAQETGEYRVERMSAKEWAVTVPTLHSVTFEYLPPSRAKRG